MVAFNGARMNLRQWLAICAAAIAITWSIYALGPAAGLAFRIATGHVPGCTALDAAAGYYRGLRYNGVLARLAAASLELRRDNLYKLIQTPRGTFWEPATAGSEVLAQLSEVESKYWAASPPVHRNDIVLDCGANVGVFTRAALDYGARRVVAIEPSPDNLECLRRNFAAEIGSGRVILCPKGVWDREEILTLYQSDHASALDSFVRSNEAHAGPRIPLTTIDKLVAELQLDRVDFIKMDIEGAEPRALEGARETLARFRPRLELEATSNAAELTGIARQAWAGYRSACVVCVENKAVRRIEPTIISLH